MALQPAAVVPAASAPCATVAAATRAGTLRARRRAASTLEADGTCAATLVGSGLALVALGFAIRRGRRVALRPSGAQLRRLARARASAREEGSATDVAVEPALQSRRALLAGTAAALAAPALLPAWAERLSTLTPAALQTARGKVAVITGATAGVGLEAARTLYSAGAEVYVTGRTLQKAEAAVADITRGLASAPGKAIAMELNLASLASVRRFADTWRREVRRPIDILACNGGLALGQGLKEPEYTEDGFELTVGTNHLSHFLLVNLLKGDLSPTARIVVTASSVHDPATGDPGAQATLGSLAGLTPGFGRGGAAMVDGGAFDAAKAYKDSKLCNVLFTLELARRLKREGSKVTANCLSPGLIPSTSFFRYQSQGFSSVFSFAASNILHIAETTEFGGDTLVYMAVEPSLEGRSGVFYSAVPPGAHIFQERTPSPEARDEAEASELWRRSAALVGL